jgi:peroxiredoxin
MRKSLLAVAFVGMVGLLAHASVKTGAKAPDFSLQDQNGNTVKLSDYAGKIVVLEWTNPECPIVQRHYQAKTMVSLESKYKDKGIVWLAINSTGSATKADDVKWRNDQSIEYPILDDSSGEVGHAYDAKNTPHMFIIDKEGNIAYQGAIDNDRNGDKKKVTNYVEKALDEILSGQPVSTPETTPYGCGVHYK